MLNYQSRFSRTKNPRDIPSLSQLMNANIIRASSTDSAKYFSRSKSKDSYLRNRSVEQQFSPLKNYNKIMTKYHDEEQDKIHKINEKLKILKLKFQQTEMQGNCLNKPKREKIKVQNGLQAASNQSNNSSSEHSAKNSKQGDRSESVQDDDNLKPMQNNKYSLKNIVIYDNQAFEKSRLSNQHQPSQNQKPRKILKGKYSQAKFESKKQESQDSLQYINDYRQYANAIRTNLMKDSSPISILRKTQYARSQTERMRKESIDDNDVDLDFNQQSVRQIQMGDAKDSEKFNNSERYKFSKDASNQNCLNSYQNAIQDKQSYNQEQSRDFKQQNQQVNKDRIQKIDRQQAEAIQSEQNDNQTQEFAIKQAQQGKRILKPSFNPLSNPVIYQSHIQSQNSHPANSRVFQSGKKPTFKQLVKMRQLNPRLVTSTILNEKNGSNQSTPVKKNFKNLIKSNYNSILMKQKQKTIKQMKESQSSKQLKDQNKQKKKNLLKAFFQQNLL